MLRGRPSLFGAPANQALSRRSTTVRFPGRIGRIERGRVCPRGDWRAVSGRLSCSRCRSHPSCNQAKNAGPDVSAGIAPLLEVDLHSGLLRLHSSVLVSGDGARVQSRRKYLSSRPCGSLSAAARLWPDYHQRLCGSFTRSGDAVPVCVCFRQTFSGGHRPLRVLSGPDIWHRHLCAAVRLSLRGNLRRSPDLRQPDFWLRRNGCIQRRCRGLCGVLRLLPVADLGRRAQRSPAASGRPALRLRIRYQVHRGGNPALRDRLRALELPEPQARSDSGRCGRNAHRAMDDQELGCDRQPGRAIDEQVVPQPVRQPDVRARVHTTADPRRGVHGHRPISGYNLSGRSRGIDPWNGVSSDAHRSPRALVAGGKTTIGCGARRGARLRHQCSNPVPASSDSVHCHCARPRTDADTRRSGRCNPAAGGFMLANRAQNLLRWRPACSSFSAAPSPTNRTGGLHAGLPASGLSSGQNGRATRASERPCVLVRQSCRGIHVPRVADLLRIHSEHGGHGDSLAAVYTGPSAGMEVFIHNRAAAIASDPGSADQRKSPRPVDRHGSARSPGRE